MKQFKKYSLSIYNTDNHFISCIKWLRSKLIKKFDHIDKYNIFMFVEDVTLPNYSYNYDIYSYNGKRLNVNYKTMYDVVCLNKEACLKVIGKITKQDIDTNISYKDLICLIESSKNWQKSTI